MISDRHKGIRHLVVLCQCVIVTVVFWLWFFLCYPLPADHDAVVRYTIYNEFLLLGLLVGARGSSLDPGLHNAPMEQTSRQSFRQLGGALFFLLLYLVAAHGSRISRSFFFSFIPLLYLILFVTNRTLPSLLGRLTFRRRTLEKVILLGPKHKALELQRWLEENKHLGMEVLGLLTEDTAPAQPRFKGPVLFQQHSLGARQVTVSPARDYVAERVTGADGGIATIAPVANPAVQSGVANRGPSVQPGPDERAGKTEPGALRVLGRPEDLEEYLEGSGPVCLVIVEFPRRNDGLRRYTELCEAHGVRLLVVADLDQMFGHSVAVFEDDGRFFLGLREEPLEDPINRFLKRGLDIAISLPVVLFILPPLMVAVWIAHRLQSPGPLFFWQERQGFHNELFRILKFRTMHVGREPDDKLPSSEQDPRLFRVGSFLRKTSLDEMPQFWNVLCGSMSVVGPRPHLKIYNDQYRKVFFRAYVRSFVKPGVTGLAQARGFRGDARTPEQVIHRMQSDIEYLENWSFGRDCWLILRTAIQVLIPPKTAV